MLGNEKPHQFLVIICFTKRLIFFRMIEEEYHIGKHHPKKVLNPLLATKAHHWSSKIEQKFDDTLLQR